MAFPNDSLSEGEEVKAHMHPHWKAMIMPTFWTAVAAAAVLTGVVFAFAPALFVGISALAVVLFLWRGLIPYIVWRSTHYVFTTKQVLYRKGVLSREDRGITLAKINDIRSNQNLFERLLGCGTMTVESAGEQGQTNLKDIPNVGRMTVLLRQLAELDEDERTLDDRELRAALKEHREEGGKI